MRVRQHRCNQDTSHRAQGPVTSNGSNNSTRQPLTRKVPNNLTVGPFTPKGYKNIAQGKRSGAAAKRHPGSLATTRNPTLKGLNNPASTVEPNLDSTGFHRIDYPRGTWRTGYTPNKDAQHAIRN